MDLIEKLGGYEKAKDKYLQLDKRMYSVKELGASLLEYRRQNNIYEAGDWIVSTLTTGLKPEFMVCKIEFIHNGIVTTTSTCGEVVNFRNSKFRHAKDAEIKACRRLDNLPDSVVQSLKAP